MNKVGFVALLSCLIYSSNGLLEVISKNACFYNLENINDTNITIDFVDGFPKKSQLYYETVPLEGQFMKHYVQIISGSEIVSDFHMRVLPSSKYLIAKLTKAIEIISRKLTIKPTTTLNMTIENTGETLEVMINNQRFEMLQAMPAINKEISIRITGIKIPKICYLESASTHELSQPVEDVEPTYAIPENCMAFNGSKFIQDYHIPSIDSVRGFKDGKKVSIIFSTVVNGSNPGFYISISASNFRTVFQIYITRDGDVIRYREITLENYESSHYPKVIINEWFEPNNTVKFDIVRKDEKFLIYADNLLLSTYTPAFLANYNDSDFAVAHFSFFGDIAVDKVCYNDNNEATNTVFDPNRMLDTETCKHNIENLDIYEMLAINLPKNIAENQSLFLYAKTKPNDFAPFMFTLLEENNQSALHVDFGIKPNLTYVWSKYQAAEYIAWMPLSKNKEFVLEIANAHGKFMILVDENLIATSENSKYTAKSFSIFGSAKVHGLCLGDSSKVF